MVMFVLGYSVIAVNPAVLKETIFHLVEFTLYVDLELSMLTVGWHENTLSLFSKKISIHYRNIMKLPFYFNFDM